MKARSAKNRASSTPSFAEFTKDIEEEEEEASVEEGGALTLEGW